MTIMPPALFNPSLIALHKQRSAVRMTQRGDDVLLSEIAHRLFSRLEDIRREFEQVEVVGSILNPASSRTLDLSELARKTNLAIRDPSRSKASNDSTNVFSESPGSRVGSFLRPGFAGRKLTSRDDNEAPDLLISFLDLHWQNDPLSTLRQAYERLAPEGLFMGVFWGGDTLHELRRVMVEVESDLTGGAGMRISPMITPYDAAALLQKSGFSLPVVDVQSLTLTYPHVQQLVEDLRTMGETAAFASTPSQPLTREFWWEVETRYQALYGLENGKIPATFEPIFMLGWRG